MMIHDANTGANYSLPFKGRVGVGMGFLVVGQSGPIPLLSSPLKGEERIGRPSC